MKEKHGVKGENPGGAGESLASFAGRALIGAGLTVLSLGFYSGLVAKRFLGDKKPVRVVERAEKLAVSPVEKR